MQSYYEILGLPVSFTLNLKALEKAYFDAQRQWHPDRFVGKPEAERAQAAEQSMRINDAYETLKNPLQRARHLLELEGVFIDDETNPPPALLMEVMEVRERLHDSAEDGRSLMAEAESLKKAMAICTQAIDDAFTTRDIPALQEEVLRLGYLGKSLEEAHMLIYRLKAAHAKEHH
ncbi:MAG: Fe-S protein assembly co-chaperone HscB [Azospirillum brasilense]|nr:MAG: Fe-S protein assembly co-chaperone HscB [Azospirillum brasilense]